MPPYQDQNGQPVPPQQPAPGQPGAMQPGMPQPPTYPNQAPAQQPAPHHAAPLTPQVPASQQYPQQPGVYAQQPVGQDSNPYSFFLDNSQPTSKKTMSRSSSGGGSSMVMRLVIALGGLTALLVTGAFVYSMLFSAPDNTDRLVGIATDQHELLRISKLGTTNVDGEKLENFAYTASLSLNSSQKELLAYLNTAGATTDTEALAVGKNPKVDEALTAAESSNTYDATYTTIMQNSLVKYEANLSQAIQTAITPEEKAVLEKQHATALLLIKQLGVPTS